MFKTDKNMHQANPNAALDVVRGWAVGAARLARFYQPYTVEESHWVPSSRSIEFTGDAPRAGNLSTRQTAQAYHEPRAPLVAVGAIDYAPAGLAWSQGTLLRMASIRQPGPKDFLDALARRGAPAQSIPIGTIIESSTPTTYGDWFAGILRNIVAVGAADIPQPLVLPVALAAKPYVQRDLQRLGVQYISSDGGVRISAAHVLREVHPLYEMGPQDAANFRRAFAISPPPARSGSILYLGRFDFASEAKDRTYPSETMAALVRARGGVVLDTREASPDRFDALASEAETVIADQGSAMFGVLHWQTRKVLELTTNRWWNSANVFLAKATGVGHYRVMVVDEADETVLRTTLDEFLAAPHDGAHPGSPGPL